MKWFPLLYLLVCLLGALCVLFTVYWLQNWSGGFAWDGSGRMFNWHPVCMVTGLVVFYGSAALVYRLPLSWVGQKLQWKLLHASLTLAAFVLSVLGLVAVFTFHNNQQIPNLYSLHSWLGLAAVLLFSCQWISGFCTFLLPLAPDWVRHAYKPIHVCFGSTIFVLSVAASISGINEKLFFNLKQSNVTAAYSSLPPEALFANSLGMLVGVFGLLVLWMLLQTSWQRPNQWVSEARQPLLEAEDGG
ncbi:lysosomal membrane ascorbate-dependent ferrireductase CYB561A3 [Ambystoma mexicanum]|uniref:lysosomal membrane ascorbate-dependent ferrireductase CYB561A3 n=1 Tax=Ambystoma mexicanum TaxID=8296 RepID=UPI0037E900AA